MIIRVCAIMYGKDQRSLIYFLGEGDYLFLLFIVSQ